MPTVKIQDGRMPFPPGVPVLQKLTKRGMEELEASPPSQDSQLKKIQQKRVTDRFLEMELWFSVF